MRKQITSLFLILGFAILVSTASAGINITDAEATYVVNFSRVDVPASPAPVSEIFLHLEEATFHKNLSSVSVPTEPLPVNEIFLHLEEATFRKNLSSVSVPTESLPVNEIFLHLEEAKTCEDLIHPTGLINYTTSPAIKNVTVTNTTDNSATIKWDTDKTADSLVKYGITSGDYTQSKSNPLFVTNHTIMLEGLSSDTHYHFVVNSTPISGNSTESLEYHFNTTEMIDQTDLSISSSEISFSNTNPGAGEMVKLSATIHNFRNAEATNVTVQFFDNGMQIGSDQMIGSIIAGETKTVQVSWTAAYGSHNISVIIDPYGEIVESDETNNAAFRLIIVSDSTDELEIIINEPTPYSTYPQGTNLTFNVTVFISGIPLDANETTVTAHLLGPSSIEKQIILLEKRNNCSIGEFYLSFNYSKGFWAIIFEANDTKGNTASTETIILVTDTYLIQASTDRMAYTLNDTVFLMARVLNVQPLKAVNDSDVNLTLSIYTTNGTILHEESLASDDDDNFKINFSAENLGTGSFEARFDVVDMENNSVNKTITFAVTDDYSVTVNLDRNKYDMGTPVDIKGDIRFTNGTGIANTPVELKLDIKGYFRIFTATTNETGGFSFTFEPFVHEAGNYTIEAKVVRDGLIRTDDSNFTIHGLYMTPETASFRMTENQSRTMNITLRNIGETELTGINVFLIDFNASDDVTAQIKSGTIPSELSPGEETTFEILVTSGQKNIEEYEVKFFNISAVTDQHSNENTTFKINLYPVEPIINVYPPDIKVGLRRNDTAIKTVTIMNTGFGSLKNVTIIQQPVLPWTSIISQKDSVDLSPGENMSVEIYIAPANAEFGIYKQNVTIKSDNYQDLTVNLTIHVTDLNNGSLFFHIDDLMGHNVNNVTVSLVSQNDSIEFKEYTAITNEEGYALIDGLPIGRYTYWVYPSDLVHFPQRGVVEVEPLFDPKIVDLTLDMHFVEFSWDVIYTPLLDSYQLLLNFTFETDVPVPVLAAYPPMIYHEIEQNQTKSSSLKLVNHGIISLFNVTLTQPVSRGGISLDFLVTDIGEIKAKNDVSIPYTVSATSDAPDCQVFRGSIEAVGDFIYFVDGKEKIGKAGTRIPYIITTPCDPGSVPVSPDPFPIPPMPMPMPPWPIQCPNISVSPELITLDEKFGCTPEDSYQNISQIIVSSNEDVKPVCLGPVLGFTINENQTYPCLKLLDDVDSVIFGFFNPDILSPGNDSIANLTDIPTTFPLPTKLENATYKYNLTDSYVAFAYGYDYPICPYIIPVTGVRVFEICPYLPDIPIPSNITIVIPDWAWNGGNRHEYYGDPPGPFSYTRHPRSPDPPGQPTVYGNTIHEIVKFSISQNATLERDAFTAQLGIFNRMRLTNVTDIDIKLHFTGVNGTDAEDMFFTADPHLRGIDNINGTGTIDPLSFTDMQWLIIPKTGAGGIYPKGIKYNISAEINYKVYGQNISYRTGDVGITVKPQPNLTLTYYIPAKVYANKPFKLAIKACNVGYGTARHFAIDSAQPEIYYNPSGLLVNFSLRNSSLDGKPMGTSLKIDFGDIYAGQCKFAWWEMVSTLDGDFTNFTGTYSHADALGGRETSLISNISTHIIHREIQSGNDTGVSFDFLVGDEIDGIPKWVIDSMYGNDTEVVNVSYSIVMWDGTKLVIQTQKIVDKWIVASIKDPNDNKVPILKVIKEDISGVVEIPLFNYWMRDGRILIVDDPVTEYSIIYTLNATPFITIHSPINNTIYSTSSINLNYSINETTVWEGYSLDGAPNVTLLGNTTLTGLTDGEHTLTIYANNTAGNMNSTTIWFTVDTTLPEGISDLQHTEGQTWLNWTWANPSDPDFNHTELYLNGTFLTNIPAPQNYYNITGLLPDTSYELNTRTVDINGNINLTWVNDTVSTLPASGTTLNLYTGWNLISLPLMPEDTSITSLLSPINGNYSIVWEYNASNTSDHGKKYDPSTPFGNDLTTMEAGKGYWIMMTSNDTLFVTGDVPGSTDIILKAGWNLIGYNSLVGQPIENVLASVSGNYSIVWADTG